MSSAEARLACIATCPLGLEELVAGELADLGYDADAPGRASVAFRSDWQGCADANHWLRTASRVLVQLGSWVARDDEQLAKGAYELAATKREWSGLGSTELFDPARTIAVSASSNRSAIKDVRWIAQRVKDGLVDAQRDRTGRRSSIDRRNADVPLRLYLENDRATLLLDTSGAPLDRRGYRIETVEAPVRENLAAACVLFSGWEGKGPVLDPMCGSGTLLIEASWFATGRAPGSLRGPGVLSRLTGRSPKDVRSYGEGGRGEGGLEPGPPLYGVDNDPQAIAATRINVEAAGVEAQLACGDAFNLVPPEGPGLLLVNPAYGVRLEQRPEDWRRLGDLLKQRYAGWTAVVLAGDPDRGKHIGLRPRRRHPVRNGPIDARVLVFDLY